MTTIVEMSPEDRDYNGAEIDEAIFGNAWPNRIEGNGGNDQIYGGKGDDQIFGGSGNDIIFGEQGNDLIYGSDIGFGGTRSSNGFDLLYGGIGNDEIYGSGALDGGPGDDKLYGGKEGANFIGGLGKDYIEGHRDGKADNHVSYFWTEEVRSSENPKPETGIVLRLHSTKAGGISVAYRGGKIEDTMKNISHIDGSPHDDILAGDGDDNILFGNQGNDTLYGGPAGGDDNLSGGEGNDKVYGGKGNDILDRGVDFGKGDDLLKGGPGDDTLTANIGTGTDKLYGGPGNDTFDIEIATKEEEADDLGTTVHTEKADVSEWNYATIYDFETGKDKIDLRSLDIGTRTAGRGVEISEILVETGKTVIGITPIIDPDGVNNQPIIFLENIEIGDISHSDLIL